MLGLLTLSPRTDFGGVGSRGFLPSGGWSSQVHEELPRTTEIVIVIAIVIVMTIVMIIIAIVIIIVVLLFSSPQAAQAWGGGILSVIGYRSHRDRGMERPK